MSAAPGGEPAQVLYAGAWGTIAAWGWQDSDSQVACRSLGYAYTQSPSFRLTPTYQDPAQWPVWAASFGCTGSEASLWGCSKSVTTEAQGNVQQVVVYCREGASTEGRWRGTKQGWGRGGVLRGSTMSLPGPPSVDRE